MEELFQPFIFLPSQQLFSSLMSSSLSPFVLPTCVGQYRGSAMGAEGKEGKKTSPGWKLQRKVWYF